jgi:glycerol-3-phosphate acyltransferase PlsX
MRILLDVMGGDLPSRALVKGGVAVGRRRGIDVVFAGDPHEIEAALADSGEKPGAKFDVLPSSQTIHMENSPVKAVREKKDSSIVLGLNALKAGDVDAFVSPGNTGAVVAGSIFILDRIPEIPRPGILASLPTLTGEDILVIDVGANSDCTPEQLVHFGLMGASYAHSVLGIDEPTTGLLNIGAERGKGNRLIADTFAQLESGPLPFAGNVEAHHLLIDRPSDIVVCDGFVGNVFLKAVEGGISAVTSLLKRTIRGRAIAMIGALLMSGSFARVKGSLSYRTRGGAPLLGVNGVVVIAHGRSDAVAIGSAVEVACREVEVGLIDRLSQGMSGWREHGR